MSALTARRTTKSRRVTLAMSGAAALLALAALTGCSAASAAPQAVDSVGAVTSDVKPDPAKAGGVGSSTTGKNFSVVLNVTNNSTYTMNWVGEPMQNLTPDSPPANIAPGGTDRIVFETNSASGIAMEPTWRVDGTEFTVHPTVGDPTIGFNSIFCTIKEVATGSPVIPTGCKIGSGYHPDAQIVFVNK